MTRAGLPHSEIPGSILVLRSPRLIAEFYVLHRYWLSRHPLSVPLCTFLCIDLTSNRSSTSMLIPSYNFIVVTKLLIEIRGVEASLGFLNLPVIEYLALISILIQRLLHATCLTVLQYSALPKICQQFFRRFLKIFGKKGAELFLDWLTDRVSLRMTEFSIRIVDFFSNLCYNIGIGRPSWRQGFWWPDVKLMKLRTLT